MSTRVKIALLAPPVVLVVTAFVLCAAHVTLGQGSFAYRWSPWTSLRLLNALFALPGIVLLALAVRAAGRVRLGLGPATTATVGALLLTAWTWSAPPRAIEQQFLNFVSPSQDGAFVLEAETAPTVRAYLEHFPAREHLSIEAIRGTRVLSNPPGTTMMVLLVRAGWGFGVIDDTLHGMMEPGDVPLAALAVKVSIVLAVLWAVALVPLYYAGRFLLPPAAALAAAGCAVFAPSCLDFSPGKDPAQLLLAALMLLGAAMAAHAHKAITRHAGALMFGAVTALSALFGLLMLWVALACGLWSLSAMLGFRTRTGATPHRLQSPARGLHALALAGTVFAGALIVAALLKWTVGLDLIATSRAVATKFAEVQPLIKVNRGIWMQIGAPIAVLFAPAALFSVLLLRKNITRRTRSGTALLGVTVLMLALTFVVGVPYELPRLWTPFLAPLIVGAFATVGIAHRNSPRAATLLAVIVALSISAAALHWTRLDVRESEYRIASQRLLN